MMRSPMPSKSNLIVDHLDYLQTLKAQTSKASTSFMTLG